ncbi:MAG: patatin, partial [Deltaproteobacteria bacterium]|nr:patatin [Deltaproteobacteria bacterium]
RYKPCPPLDEVVMLSLGTGANLQFIAGATKDWGYAQWAKPLVSLLLDGTAGIADYQCEQMLGDRYHRLAPVLPADRTIDMDDVAQVPWMVDHATQDVAIADTVAWLEQNW